jgi:hypothetical protein
MTEDKQYTEMCRKEVLMKIDKKYIGEIRKNDGTLVPKSEWIVFRAKDLAIPAMLTEYLNECIRIGAKREHIKGVMELIIRVLEYQEKNPHECKIPDTLKGELEKQEVWEM